LQETRYVLTWKSVVAWAHFLAAIALAVIPIARSSGRVGQVGVAHGGVGDGAAPGAGVAGVHVGAGSGWVGGWTVSKCIAHLATLRQRRAGTCWGCGAVGIGCAHAVAADGSAADWHAWLAVNCGATSVRS
jgi:hypothetical protein